MGLQSRGMISKGFEAVAYGASLKVDLSLSLSLSLHLSRDIWLLNFRAQGHVMCSLSCCNDESAPDTEQNAYVAS